MKPNSSNIQHCCASMVNALTLDCKLHSDKFDCPDVLISYSEKFNEYGIIIHNGGTASSRISYCPWCGKKLPESMRQKWFDEIEKLGIDPWKEDVPQKYETNEWYSEKQGE